MSLLQIVNLNAHYENKPVLKNCNIFLEESEIVSIVGESGSGKSTILKILLAIAKPSEKLTYSGKIFFNGKNFLPGKHPSIQLVYQEPALSFNPNWELKDCLLEPQVLLGLDKNSYQIDMYTWLEKFHISTNVLSQKITQFSGGELQRIAMIRAILAKPKVVCMDEPVSGLDRIVLTKTISYIQELQKTGISLLIVSHDLEFVKQVSNRVYILEKGNIVEFGNTQEVFTHPKHKYTQVLLKARDLSGIRKT